MNQLFYNLIGNALKFSKPDVTPEVRIAARSISAEEANRRLDGPPTAARYHHITVADNGIGFEVRYTEQIFEVFKRLHGRDAYPGSGIGLALCKRIVANHGGALYAESELGKGSTFNILLPQTGV
jgi:signal transduction histidine kinase